MLWFYPFPSLINDQSIIFRSGTLLNSLERTSLKKILLSSSVATCHLKFFFSPWPLPSLGKYIGLVTILSKTEKMSFICHVTSHQFISWLHLRLLKLRRVELAIDFILSCTFSFMILQNDR